MKRVLQVVALCCAVLLGGLGFYAFMGWRALNTPMASGDTEVTLIQVDRGESVISVAQELEDKQVIPSAFWFGIAARVTGASFGIGMYHVSPGTTPLTILAQLENGAIAEVRVTFPEGWRSEQILERLLTNRAVVSRDSFTEAIRASSLYPELVAAVSLQGDEPLEGFLFPDTYRFGLEADGQDVVQSMVENFIKRTEGLSLTYDTVKLASIVEREARHDEDRPLIAGVYANRLEIGMGLDADPTVQFSKANNTHQSCVIGEQADEDGCREINWWPTITVADYRGELSPFNTYINRGLPPAPIANPGRASLEAAQTPAQHDYLYFVTDSAGKAHFATTLAEHQRNKATYLR